MEAAGHPQGLRLHFRGRPAPQPDIGTSPRKRTLSREPSLPPAPHVSIDDRLARLNPNGPERTKQCRPTAPLIDPLLPFVRATDGPAFVLWNGRSLKGVKHGFVRAVEKSGLSPEITPYSLRHMMAKKLRKRAVPAWEVRGMLGHRVPGARRNTPN